MMIIIIIITTATQKHRRTYTHLDLTPLSEIRMIESRRMRSAGHVTRMGRIIHIGYLWESQNERDHQEYIDACAMIIIN
jgi:hypothetical protein